MCPSSVLALVYCNYRSRYIEPLHDADHTQVHQVVWFLPYTRYIHEIRRNSSSYSPEPISCNPGTTPLQYQTSSWIFRSIRTTFLHSYTLTSGLTSTRLQYPSRIEQRASAILSRVSGLKSHVLFGFIMFSFHFKKALQYLRLKRTTDRVDGLFVNFEVPALPGGRKITRPRQDLQASRTRRSSAWPQHPRSRTDQCRACSACCWR